MSNKYVPDDYAFVADILKETGTETVCLNDFANGTPCEVVFSGVVNRSQAGDIAEASDHLPVMPEIRLPEKQ